MAISIIQDLPTTSPAYNEMVVVVEQTTPALLNEDNYKFVFEIYIALSGTPIRFNVYPDIDNPTLGKLDVHKVLEPYVKSFLGDQIITGAAIGTADQSLNFFRIEYGWSYIDSSGVYQETLNDLTGSDKYFWEGVFDWYDFVDEINEPTPFNTYLCNTTNGTSAEFLTNKKTKKVTLTDNGFTQALTDVPSDIDYMEVKTYDSSNVLISTFQIATSVSPASFAARNISLRSAPQSLNDYTGAFLAGAQPIITASVAYYTIQLFETTPTAVSEILTFELQEGCRYDIQRLHFHNKLGGFDAFNFTKASKKTTDINRKTYKTTPSRLSGSGYAYSYKDKANITYYVSKQETMKLTSDWLTDEEHEWLLELVASPEIYLETVNAKGDVQYKPIEKVNQKSYVELNGNLDKLFNLEIEITFSQLDYTQRA